MNLIATLRRTLASYKPDFLKSRRNNNESVPTPDLVQGTPPNMAPERLDLICIENFQSPLHSSCYAHLSAWKSSGAYRLLVKLTNGSEVSMIFKDAIYDHKHIPALENLPISPGPSEYAVFSSKHHSLSWLTSQVFLAEEITPRLHYQYLLEDLSPHYHTISPGKWILHVVDLLPQVHASLAYWHQSEQPPYLIDFGHHYQNQLFGYVKNNLSEYSCQFESKNVTKTLRLIEHLEDLFNQRVCGPPQPLVPIHGDLNYSNIFIHKENPSEIKLIDWEWAGLGLPHADLVSLLKGSPQPLEKLAFNRYAHLNQDLSLKQHECLYLWCKIERGLLDASFLAAQAIRTSNQTNFSLHAAVSSSLNRALSAHQSLSG